MPTKQDNTRVQKPKMQEKIPYKPRQYYFIDLGGEPSKDTRTASERNKDYWHPIKGAKERFKSSMQNKTNPLVGIENIVLPALAGAALVTTPATLIGGAMGSQAVNNMTGGFGEWVEDKTGIPSELAEYLNPGAVYGGTKGYNITKNKLASKFIKGDADLGWNALNKDHWIFNKESRNPTNIAMATLNRTIPFLSNIEKTPARIAAYKVGRRTKGNASVSLKDIKSNESTYTGSSTPEGNNGDRDLLGMYLFKNDPLISRSAWFKRISNSFKPTKEKGFSYDKRYSDLYPGIEGRRYQMQSVVKEGYPLKFSSIDEFNSYSNGIGKIQGKEGDMVIETPMGFQTFRQPGTNYVGPIDDVGGHLVKIDYNNKGKLTQISQDIWKFNPADYAKRWSGNTKSEAVRANKQAALMDKVGTPFILQQKNPIYIGRSRIWESLDKVLDIIKRRRQPSIQSGLLVMKKGGSLTSDGRRFKFKDSPLVRNAKALNNKRDMRKKFMKSDRPTYTNNRVKKGQRGLKFVSYEPVETPSLKFPEVDIFSPYYFPDNEQTYKVDVLPETNKEVEKVEEVKEEPKQETPIVKPTTNIKFKTTKDFIDTMKPIYESILTSKGIDKSYADYLVAQAALESNWGKSQSGKNNLSGIKLIASQKGKGLGTVRRTREVINGKDVYINDEFRDFDSLEDFANYHVNLLNNKRYNAFSGDFISSVVKGGYATDPKYKNVLTSVYNQIKS